MAVDNILGVAAERIYRPESAEECADVMAREVGRIGFIGGGTALGLGHPPAALDAIVHTGGMARILDYAPADMVLTAEAGVTAAQLQEAAGAERQMLALDPPHPDRATVGGLVATAGFGPRRARYGAIRDLIIGVTLIRAGGTIARGGGKVVKNVAGFDLPKLMCGSLGTLGMIATATFRLHPRPEMSATAVAAELPAARVVAMVGEMRQAQLEPSSAVALRRPDATYDLGIRFEGFGPGVRLQMDRIGGIAPAGDDSFWARHDRARAAGPLRARLSALPARFGEVDALVGPILDALGGGTFAWYATLGIGFAGGEVADPAGATRALAAARDALVAAGGSLVVEAAPPEMRGLDPWGPVPDSFPLMAQLKRRFDPRGVLNPGRFVGRL